jgi:hypothetical protein
MLGTVPPVDEKIGQHRHQQELQRVTSEAERREPGPQRNGHEVADAERLPEIVDRPGTRHRQRYLDKIHCEPGQAGS